MVGQLGGQEQNFSKPMTRHTMLLELRTARKWSRRSRPHSQPTSHRVILRKRGKIMRKGPAEELEGEARRGRLVVSRLRGEEVGSYANGVTVNDDPPRPTTNPRPVLCEQCGSFHSEVIWLYCNDGLYMFCVIYFFYKSRTNFKPPLFYCPICKRLFQLQERVLDSIHQLTSAHRLPKMRQNKLDGRWLQILSILQQIDQKQRQKEEQMLKCQKLYCPFHQNQVLQHLWLDCKDCYLCKVCLEPKVHRKKHQIQTISCLSCVNRKLARR